MQSVADRVDISTGHGRRVNRQGRRQPMYCRECNASTVSIAASPAGRMLHAAPWCPSFFRQCIQVLKYSVFA